MHYYVTRNDNFYLRNQLQLTSETYENIIIDEYGRKFTEMFVELTISQSDWKDETFKVLKPLNEKHAIKYFADGLRNRRLNTLITAKNYDCLKDAVQAAIGEEIPSPLTSSDAMRIFRSKYQYNYRNPREQATSVRKWGMSYTQVAVRWNARATINARK